MIMDGGVYKEPRVVFTDYEDAKRNRERLKKERALSRKIADKPKGTKER